MMRYRPGRAGGPWTTFGVAVQFLLLFPLLPLGAELAFTSRITVSSLMLMTSTYAISLSMSSNHIGRWAFGMTIGIVFSTLFGWSMGRGDGVMGPAYQLGDGFDAASGLVWGAIVGVGLTMLVHIFERAIRHVVDKEPFPEFLKGRR